MMRLSDARDERGAAGGRGASAQRAPLTATVLVVDDDPLISCLASEILGKDFRVEACQSGMETAARAAALRPDLILLDINLGGMTGFDVLRTLRAHAETADIPVIFLTGESDESAEIEGFRSGAADFVRKPFVPEVLLRRAQRVIELKRLQSDLQSEVRRQMQRAERLTKEMMLALSQAVDAKDHYTNGHSERVAAYSAEIARRMGKSPEEQAQIYEMGLMHDIGKIGVSEDIINKATYLSDAEFIKIKRHTLIGSEILRHITEMPELADGARSHHERYDGTGYPDGLKGKNIPEAARIICLADCYDAMTSTRTYSSPRAQKDVRTELIRCSGTQFDPDVVRVMVEMIDEDKDFIMNERTAGIRVWKDSDRLWALPEALSPAVSRSPAPEAGSGDEPAVDLPDWLQVIDGLDTALGQRHCGTVKIYLDTLAIYARNAAAGADEIEDFWNAGNISGVTSKIHALKSTSRAIGAESLGALAETLEAAGKAGDDAALSAGVGDLLARYRALGQRLAPLLRPAANKDGASLPPISPERLRGAYGALRAFAHDANSGGAADLLRFLDGFSLPADERARVDKLRDAVASFDWDDVGDILAN